MQPRRDPGDERNSPDWYSGIATTRTAAASGGFRGWSELTRSVRWDCDSQNSAMKSASSSPIGSDQISTVGLRRLYEVVRVHADLFKSEVTRSVLWDCDRRAIRIFLLTSFIVSELTRSLRWDCDSPLHRSVPPPPFMVYRK